MKLPQIPHMLNGDMRKKTKQNRHSRWNKQSEERYRDEGIEKVKRYNSTGLQNIVRW